MTTTKAEMETMIDTFNNNDKRYTHSDQSAMLDMILETADHILISEESATGVNLFDDGVMTSHFKSLPPTN